MFFATVCAFRLGHKCLNFVMGLSRDPMSFALSHGPSRKATNHSNVTHQVAPVLACPAVPKCDSTKASLVSSWLLNSASKQLLPACYNSPLA